MTEYAAVRHTDNPITRDSVVRLWTGYPRSLDLPNGKRLVSPVGVEHVGMEHGDFRFVEVVRVDWPRPGRAYTLESETYDLTATTLTATRVWTPWTQQELDNDTAARKQAEIDAWSGRGEASIMYQLAKQINPSLTPAQFATFVANNWPEPS